MKVMIETKTIDEMGYLSPQYVESYHETKKYEK